MSGSSAKIKNKKDWRGSSVASSMPKSVLSIGREDRLLREWIFVRTFHRWGGLVFVMGDHDNFPNLMMKPYFSHWVRDFISLSFTD